MTIEILDFKDARVKINGLVIVQLKRHITVVAITLLVMKFDVI